MAHDKSCFFTGHRILPTGELPKICIKLDREIENMITKNGVTDFFCGGALGFDMLAAERVLAAREKFEGIQLIMALPCRNQTEKWRNGAEIRRYENILSKADFVFYICEEYEKGCMYKRNRFMADRSKFGIAYRTHYHGGTDYTVKYAQEIGCEMTFIADVPKKPLPFL